MDTALTLTTDMKLVLGLVGFTMAMFLFERIRADVVALVVLVLLGLSGLVSPEEIFGGFSSNAVMAIIATMILGAGLDRTGALNRLAAWLLRRAHGVESRLMLLTGAVAGLNSSIMQNPSVMALYLPVASRLSSRTGLPLPRLLLPIGLALLTAALAYFHFFGDRLLHEDGGKGATPARTQSYFANAYGIEGDVYELTVTADSPLVGMSLGEAETLHGAPLILALKTKDDSRLSPPADARIWVGSVIGAMGPKRQVGDFAQNQMLRMNSRLRNFGDLFNPSRAGISEAVIPATSKFIGKTARDLQLRRSFGLSLLAINRDKKVLREDARDAGLRAGDMLVLHSIWTDLAEAAKGKDLVVITDYPKGEQRPHKLKIALAIFAVALLLALSSRLPVSASCCASSTSPNWRNSMASTAPVRCGSRWPTRCS